MLIQESTLVSGTYLTHHITLSLLFILFPSRRVKLNRSSESQIIQVATKDRTSAQQLIGHNDTSYTLNYSPTEDMPHEVLLLFDEGQLAVLSLSKGVYIRTWLGHTRCTMLQSVYKHVHTYLSPKTHKIILRMKKLSKCSSGCLLIILLCHASFDLKLYGSVFFMFS